MKSKILSLIASLFYALLSLGQTSSSDSKALQFKGGVIGGITMSQIHGDGVGGFNKLGVNAGFTIQVLNSKYRGVNLGVIYNQKGSRKPPNPNIEGDNTWAYKFTYFDLPVVYTMEIEGVHVEFGVQPSVLISAKENMYNVGYDPTGIPVKDFDLSVVLGAQLQIDHKMRLFTRLTQSAIAIAPKPEDPLNRWNNAMRNMTLEIGVIALFALRDK
tara:strand:+ start:42 stop:686 length:645 start_codon:yes stop_codon:yes gene_type:complete